MAVYDGSIPSMTTPTEVKFPYLFVDLYPFDFDDPRTPNIEDPPWAALAKNELVRGVILKATDGVQYPYTSWFVRNFGKLVQVAADARGQTFLLGGYHYVQLLADAKVQADLYCKALLEAEWGPMDIVPTIDVEAGGERAANRRASPQQVIDCVTALAERIIENTGRRVMLYGRGLQRDLRINSRMGCAQVWNPSYTKFMSMNGLSSVDDHPGPWKVDDVVLWQYDGDGVGDSSVTKLPLALAGFGKVDVSVYVDGSRPPDWSRAKGRLL